jgi:hypothetical protein
MNILFVKRMLKGQAAFEYMMSYGWAVLVVCVLGIALWNLGIFNPSTVGQSVGFSVLRPNAWNFVGGNTSSSYATLAVSNIGGIDLTLGINGSNPAYAIMFKKPGAPHCGFLNQSVWVRSEIGENATMTLDAVNGVWTVGIPAGTQLSFGGQIVGVDPTYTCGGPSGGAYSFTIAYQYALDQYNIQHTDVGRVNGKYQ